MGSAEALGCGSSLLADIHSSILICTAVHPAASTPLTYPDPSAFFACQRLPRSLKYLFAQDNTPLPRKLTKPTKSPSPERRSGAARSGMEVRCQCHSVQFTTPTPKPLALYVCHCGQCRLQTGSAFGTSAIFPKFPLPAEQTLACYA